ncbi:hypothetical protein ONV78_27060 [Hahella sp. CR1]|uniref:SO2930 family diheme c-type cytochrome n=1 Tax=Hahella sp. CR1 TaxID=2992807 RepID=UPI0024410AD5|nr:SO2930 family diheme c-type cytochrome [Hahella sp. CR1]MDG9671423.1 hypothetical protein [Hahella sp. CR1]
MFDKNLYRLLFQRLIILVLISLAGPVKAEQGESWPPAKLSSWEIFTITENKLSLNREYLPYNVKLELFADYAKKYRAIKVPVGKKIRADASGVLSYPEGTVLVKTFYYPSAGTSPPNTSPALVQTLTRDIARDNSLIETRVLIKKESVWQPLVYRWNKSKSDAELLNGGGLETISVDSQFELQNFTYLIPSRHQCIDCHGGYNLSGELAPLGPVIEQLNIEVKYASKAVNQLELWFLSGLLALDTIPQNNTVLDTNSARDYLHVHCGHCHNANGLASSSRLYLTKDIQDLYRLGVCKPPIAAGNASLGLKYDIVPGQPEKSLLLRRLSSVTPEVMMPELGRSRIDQEGVDLVSAWIRQLSGICEK